MKEITEYFDKKYPSLSGRLYLEKSNEVTTVHWFADYQDLASFRRINTELGSDEEFRAIWRKIISFIVEGTIQQTLLTPAAFFDQEKPVADLSKGQEGKSTSPVSIWDHSEKYLQEKARVSRSRFPVHSKCLKRSVGKSPL